VEEIKRAKLAATMELLENWSEWDDIIALANHQTVKNYLLGSINEIRTNHHDPHVNALCMLREI
jgi:hypothetical protein